MTQHLNIFSVYSLDRKFNIDTELFLSELVTILTKICKITLKNIKIANYVSTKLFVYLPDDKPVPIGFMRDGFHSSDVTGEPLGDNMRLYVKTFEFKDDFKLKLFPFCDNVDEMFVMGKMLQLILSKIQIPPPQQFQVAPTATTNTSPQPVATTTTSSPTEFQPTQVPNNVFTMSSTYKPQQPFIVNPQGGGYGSGYRTTFGK